MSKSFERLLADLKQKMAQGKERKKKAQERKKEAKGKPWKSVKSFYESNWIWLDDMWVEERGKLADKSDEEFWQFVRSMQDVD